MGGNAHNLRMIFKQKLLKSELGQLPWKISSGEQLFIQR
ncbi:hypothetical protein EcSMS35_4826 [Escherichia coli SMS-3-5]|uniref:Uncharacterized protein n=1 Tax=Escherichia coli (strain SMS-3-5 / SECEC) TaxID=439855 RepID=B1LDN6_ECOSM|nr:hypothetical protein EcSMS35_4826 [Escherichia coli SMS-3-5]